MFDAHVNTAIEATHEDLTNMGMMVSIEAAAYIFREAAAMRAEERQRNLEEDADRNEYELGLEM